MTIYLLDTHILLWWLSNDVKLSKKIKNLIASPEAQIVISAVTIWEIVIKKSLNKLETPDNLKECLDLNNFKLLPMTVDHALHLAQLPFIHNDPFDRLLIAQCMVDNLTMVTADAIIPRYNLKCF